MRARRVTEDAELVSLEYEIQRGPRTLLTIDGCAFSNDTIEQMEAAWATAVFNEFLINELRELARQGLINAESVEAMVDGQVITRPGANENEVHLQIQPGRRFSERRIVFRGNQQVSDLDLADFVDARGLTKSLWTNPEASIIALTALYRDLGFLEAEIDVGKPEFDGDHAILTIVIDEDAAYQIAEVRISGATRLDDGTVRSVAGIAVGDRYSAVLVQQVGTTTPWP